MAILRRLLLLLSLWPAWLLLPVSAQTATDDNLQWNSSTSAEGAHLNYGAPDSDWVVISFYCDRATKEIAIAYDLEPIGAEEGMTIEMELFSEAGQVLLPATGHRMELDDAFLLEARTFLSPQLAQLLRDGETLTIMVQDGSEEIPLAGAEQGVAQLIEACGP